MVIWPEDSVFKESSVVFGEADVCAQLDNRAVHITIYVILVIFWITG